MIKNKATIESCLVTGGSGFLGGYIVKALLDRGCKVTSLDIVPQKIQHENLTAIQGDLSNVDSLTKACENIDTVFHTAAIICLYGGPAASKAFRDRAYSINVQGTENVIKACIQAKVKRLVHTSSNNVVFDGKPCPNMDMNTPYSNRVIDLYTETKIAAEKLALAQNGKDGLLTCAIRPSGIYGPGVNYMMDNMVREIFLGRFVAAIGNPNSMMDNSYVGNVAHAHVLAAEALVAGNAACGNAYFITDADLKNNMEFFRPIVEGLGYTFPTFFIPVKLLRPVAIIWEWLHFTCGFPVPMVKPIEVEKAGITHFASMKDAERDLGYVPIVSAAEAMKLCVPYCQNFLEELKKA